MKFKNGQKLWVKAKKIIPGGSMLFSKRSELFLPKFWPAYFKKSKGCEIWDLKGKKFTDVSLMGVGTNILGYGNKKVDNAVKKIIKLGNMSTLNCPEEVMLAEEMIKLNKWSDAVRFTRSGGEANSVAIRIARAASNKEGVAVCGYHGWHDWYLAAKLKNKKNLDKHLMTGLLSQGVPKQLKNTIYTFEYNDINQLENLLKTKKNIGTIKLEVSRNFLPINNFLIKVKNLSKKYNKILIFDECSSGFRECLGGLHKKYKINPDIAVYGKALGNGYAINAIVGKKQVMKFCEKTFISSTFWTERIGPSAALATLEEMKKQKSWIYITKMGNFIKNRWREMSNKYELEIAIQGLDSMANFYFKSKSNQILKTFITQEMLKRGYLATNSIYVSTAHSEKIVIKYLKELEKIFKFISINKNKKNYIKSLIKGNISQSGFVRLN